MSHGAEAVCRVITDNVWGFTGQAAGCDGRPWVTVRVDRAYRAYRPPSIAPGSGPIPMPLPSPRCPHPRSPGLSLPRHCRESAFARRAPLSRVRERGWG